MSFIGSPFINSRSNLSRTSSPSRFGSTSYSNYGNSSNYTPSNYSSSNYSYSPSNYSSNCHSSSTYKPYSSSPRSSFDTRSSHYDSGLSLKSNSTNSLNDLNSSNYLNRSSPSSYLSAGNASSNLNTFRRSSLNSRRRANTLSPARERINSHSLSNLNDNYPSPTIIYSNYVNHQQLISLLINLFKSVFSVSLFQDFTNRFSLFLFFSNFFLASK